MVRVTMNGATPGQRTRLVVVGNGMVGHRFVEELDRLGALPTLDVVVLSEEPVPAYDRVALSSLFDGKTESDLALADTQWYNERGVELILNATATSLDCVAKTVGVERDGKSYTYAYDLLVLASGSVPFVPPVPGRERAGSFVYRTIGDLRGIQEYAAHTHVQRSLVVGGGLLGLEAANALRLLGLETEIVEFAPRLMPLQLCDGGARALQARVQGMGLSVTTGAGVTALEGEGVDGPVQRVRLGESEERLVEVVVFSAGVRPRDELARLGGLVIGERGGVVVDDRCVSSDPSVFAIGECALIAGRVWGLVAPGYDMAAVAASVITADRQVIAGADRRFIGGDLSTKLKLLGVDVISFGDAHGNEPGTTHATYADERNASFRRIVLDAHGRVVGGVLVGDAEHADILAAMARGEIPSPQDAHLLVLPNTSGRVAASSELPDALKVCSCNGVSAGSIRAAVKEDGLVQVGAVQRATNAGTGCGGCVPLVKRLVDAELAKQGVVPSEAMCEHFPFSRAQLFDIVRVSGTRTFESLVSSHGTGLGCAICKPAVASMFASLSAGHVLDGEHASLQDSNDHFLANLQKDGSYSVVPRVPGGEITPHQLIVIGSVAAEFGLYTKITGGQRIDLFGARVEQLPAIWQRLIDAGMESGHAYGKALRTVKSCVGQTWCRYGVQDSTSMAIQLELRYRGLRAPHKIKMAVSGCARECAEAQSKDVGVIATESGWNLYVCGNGGMRPRHADLLAENMSDDELVRYIDRFLAFYIRTADRLERTSTWLERRPGGIDELRAIVCADSLGLAPELEGLIARHVDQYQCEWSATLADPRRVELFRSFVNSDEPDDGIVFVSEREQIRPATPAERVRIDLVSSGERS
jgi:nitrite reductase (NADH) large subunit